MPSWNVRSNNSERAKSWMTSSRQSGLWISRIDSTLHPLRFPRPERKRRGDGRPLQRLCQGSALGKAAEQGVGGSPGRFLLLDLGPHPRALRGQELQTLLEFGDAVEFEVFTHSLQEALA